MCSRAQRYLVWLLNRKFDFEYDRFTLQHFDLLTSRVKIQVVHSIHFGISEAQIAENLAIVHFERFNDADFLATDMKRIAACGSVFDFHREFDSVRVHFPLGFALGFCQDPGIFEINFYFEKVSLFDTVIIAVTHATTMTTTAHAATAHPEIIVTAVIMIVVVTVTIAVTSAVRTVIVFFHPVVEGGKHRTHVVTNLDPLTARIEIQQPVAVLFGASCVPTYRS
jgi:hypothetical protein